MEQNKIKIKGVITKMHSINEYDVKLENNIVVKGHVSGKMRVHKIRMLPGDIVDVELSTYDLSKGRITFRHKLQPDTSPNNDKE